MEIRAQDSSCYEEIIQTREDRGKDEVSAMDDSELKEIETLTAGIPLPTLKKAFEGDTAAISVAMDGLQKLFAEKLSLVNADRLTFLLLKKWYEEGDKDTLRYLPNFYSTGRGHVMDTEDEMRDAVSYALEAESLGLGRGSEYELHIAYSGRFPDLCPEDRRLSNNYLHKAVSKEDPRAMFEYAVTLESGSYREKSLALDYYEKAGRAGNPDGYLCAARMLSDKEFRLSVDEGNHRYTENATEAIVLGRAEGYFYLGYAHIDGTLGSNVVIALQLLIEGAKLGDEKCIQARDSIFELYHAQQSE